MPKMISELAQGNQFSRSSDGGQLADTATRVWKIILDSPSESIDIMSAVGVQIGDPYSASNPIPCVSVEGRADGESRLVRIVTAQYRTSGMVDGEGGTGLPDPMLVMPELRPASFSTSTSLYEEAAYSWYEGDDISSKPIKNPVGDVIDGITQMSPITTIRVTQFNMFPGTIYASYVGYVNEEVMNLGQYATFEKHEVLFRGVEAQPHVETFGIAVYSGFMNSYEFAHKSSSWNITIPVTGFNCKAFDPAQPGLIADPYAMPLKKNPDTLEILQPLKLQDGVNVGDKVRAMVRVAGFGDKVTQQPSAQPVALSEAGLPLNSDQEPLLWDRRVQRATNLTQLLQLRLS